ncbi:hypothetical protein [Streptomyces sp. SAI-041]|uniref:hypothetical protein n=1 Tax=Streptomyces sp. SAI-041 TaxID=2940548 RepID=UPI002474284D|nr:hypothetical protein [Streptomyces sp. SAI-041]MDH6554698.1 hypothetical protein [Streptomyces sp. SAI-041]
MKKRIESYPRVRTEGGDRAVVPQAGGVLLVETVRKAGLDTARPGRSVPGCVKRPASPKPASRPR